jgi:hypothetical protein
MRYCWNFILSLIQLVAVRFDDYHQNHFYGKLFESSNLPPVSSSSVQISQKGNYGNFGNFGSNTSEVSASSKNSVISEISKTRNFQFPKFRKFPKIPMSCKIFENTFLWLYVFLKITEISVISFFGNLYIPRMYSENVLWLKEQAFFTSF